MMHASTRPNSTGLAALEARLAQDLDFLELPAKPWVPETRHDGTPVRDVVVIGAGMCGLAATARLVFAGITNVVAYDAAPAGLEGPWVTFARMQTLRSPKTLHGPALGMPQLTFRAWFTAQWGVEAWQALDKIPKDQWMDYLVWYRTVLALPVRNNVRMTGIAPAGEFIAIDIEGAETGRVLTRHLVLATGRSGLGGFAVPDFLKGIDRAYWAHSADEIDFDALKGKRVAVIGAGASSMDNAATALEAGAGSVDMLIRRKEMPRINKMTGIGSQGVVHGMHQLPDIWKWKFVDYTASTQTPPPSSSTRRVSRHSNSRFFLDCGIVGIRQDAEGLLIETTQGAMRYDFLIAATGFQNDLHGRPEFAAIAPHIRNWSDGRYTAEMGPPRMGMSEAPDLGSSFEFRERVPGSCPMLAHIHCFNDAATLTHGKVSGDIPAVSAGADRLVRGIAASLFAKDVERHFDNLVAFDIPELQGDEWVDSTPLLHKEIAL
ncbi:cation diffusion facilitator CzcD-associated flavoprotein CzcO [Aminobacter lissarensis]|uniref:Cation diffusion facilitator CzcD-associated flavoprotein CzcO n=1 Tax=Aminobacter carboxidus TaxID=376165 RepID=A0A8E1WA26_9HYPH|nr:NAD(P)/FAD-dependent oxidoreductase [Aminobacter lissarensis]MBB6464866.1 cation diffusion facilitator CzcD-associated flavoprotein CzcO [Aminobacter lissarensis]